MIFVTVGTHEQPMNSLIQTIDNLVKERKIKEEVIMQLGYSTYEPKFCKYNKIMSYDEMKKNMDEARIVITHGGPGSIFLAIDSGKKPIVVPRDPSRGEHVDEHQILFAKRMVKKNQIICVLELENLYEAIKNYNTEKVCSSSNLDKFIEGFEREIESLFRG